MKIVDELVVKTYDTVFRAVKYEDGTVEILPEGIERAIVTNEEFYEGITDLVKNFLWKN